LAENFGIGSLGGLGSLPGMLDSVEFLKRAWSTFNVPKNLTPTMDLEELDRRIADLKAVEQWLNVNLNMLRGTIQGLEIQRGTLAAIQSFSQAMAPGHAGDAMAQAVAGLAAMQRAASDAFAGQAAGKSMPAGATDEQEAAAQASTAAGEPPRPVAEPGSGEAAGGRPSDDRDAGAPDVPEDSPAPVSDGLSRAAASVNPAAWWNLLQSQFNQITQAAIAGAGAGLTGAGAAARPPADADRAVPQRAGRAGGKAAAAGKPAKKAARGAAAPGRKARKS
jgi:hypothetical protein